MALLRQAAPIAMKPIVVIDGPAGLYAHYSFYPKVRRVAFRSETGLSSQQLEGIRQTPGYQLLEPPA